VYRHNTRRLLILQEEELFQRRRLDHLDQHSAGWHKLVLVRRQVIVRVNAVQCFEVALQQILGLMLLTERSRHTVNGLWLIVIREWLLLGLLVVHSLDQEGFSCLVAIQWVGCVPVHSALRV